MITDEHSIMCCRSPQDSVGLTDLLSVAKIGFRENAPRRLQRDLTR